MTSHTNLTETASGEYGIASTTITWPATIVPGTTEEKTVTELVSGTTHYFKIRSEDDKGNWSEWSDIASEQTHSLQVSEDGQASIEYKTATLEGKTTDVYIIEESTEPGTDAYAAVSTAAEAGLGIFSNVYDILPDGALFSPDAVFKVHYDSQAVVDAGLTEEDINIYKYDPIGELWNKINLLERNTVENWISVKLPSASLYAVFGPVPDTTSPVTSIELIGNYFTTPEDETFVSPGSSFTLTAADPVSYEWGDGTWSSGVDYMEYKINNNMWKVYESTVTISSEIPEEEWEGEHTIKYRSADNAGNVEEENELKVLMDITPPESALAKEGFRQVEYEGVLYISGDTEFYLTASDAGTDIFTPVSSGVKDIYYRLNNNPWEMLKDTAQPVEVSEFEPKTNFDEGSHQFWYYSTDNVNNTEPVSVVELFCDRTPPSITITSPVGGEVYTAKLDTITLNFMVADNSPAPVEVAAYFTHESGSTMTVINGQKIEPLDIESGMWTLTVEAEDIVGNSSVSVTEEFEVIHDIQPPRTSVSIASPKYIVEGSTYITSSTDITLSAVDDLVEIGDGIGLGVDYTLFRINEGPWEEYDVAITIPGEGINIVEYYSVDVVGNTEEVRALTLKVDNTPPGSELNSGSPLYESGGIVYVSSETPHYLTSTDPVVNEVASGVDYASYKIDNSFWNDVQSPVEEYEIPEVLEEGIRTISYYAVDNVENTEAENSKIFHVDTTAPETELSIVGVKYISSGKTYINASSRVKLTAYDPVSNEVASGVRYTQYRIDGGPWQYYGEEFMLSEGIREVDYRSIDNVNNTENIKSFTLYVDDTPPVTTLHTSGPRHEAGDKTYINTTTVIDFTSADPVFNDVAAGVKNIKYKIDDGEFNLFNTTFTLTEGIHTLSYYSTDNVENKESLKTKVFYVDGTPPETEISAGEPYLEVFNLKIISPDTLITLSAKDPVSEDVASGVQYSEYRIDEGNWLTYSEPFTLEAGTHKIDYRSTDNVENTEEFKSITYAVTYLTDYALLSESSLKISGNAEVYGDVRSNGVIKAEGNAKVDGDVTASTVTVSGKNVDITGKITENAAIINPWGIDLDEVEEWVKDNNDNEKLDLSNGVLKAAGTKEIVVPAGIYYLAGIDVSGQAKLTFQENVNIFLTGSLKTSGKAHLNTSGGPYNLIIFSNSYDTDVISGQGSLESIIYAPYKFINVSGNGLSLGNMLAREIHVTGNAIVTGAGYEGGSEAVSAASVGLNSGDADGEFKLGEVYSFPNPAKGGKDPTIHFECGIADRVEIRIYNIAAELVHTKEISGSPQIVNGKYAYEYTWDTSGIASGVYLYLVRGQKDGEVLQKIRKLAIIK